MKCPGCAATIYGNSCRCGISVQNPVREYIEKLERQLLIRREPVEICRIAHNCKVCSHFVDSDETDIGVLCPSHKDEILRIRNENKFNLIELARIVGIPVNSQYFSPEREFTSLKEQLKAK
jgi:hypothetical protein